MEITYEDDNTMIIQPSVVWHMLLMGLVLVSIGLLTTVQLGTKHHLTCERASYDLIACQLKRTLLGKELKNEDIVNLHEARLQTNRSPKGGKTYQVILVTAFDDYAFTAHSTSDYNGQNRIAADINTFLQSPNSSHLDVSYGGINTIGVEAIFVLIGLGTLIVGAQPYWTTWTFDRAQRVITHRRLTLLGIRVTEYPLRDVVGARVDSRRGTRGRTYYRVELLLRDGAPLPLLRWHTQGESEKEHTVQAIRAFLKHRPDSRSKK